MIKIFITLLVFGTAIYMVIGSCNVCSPITNLACVDDASFKICVEGYPNPPRIQCPNGTVCTTGNQICATPDTPNIERPCNGCKECNDDKIFACETYNTFKLCLGTDNKTSEEYTCPKNLVCNKDSDTICVPIDAGIGSTCSWSTLPATPPETPAATVSPAENPTEYCKNKAVRGRYDVPSDITCKEYISCYQSNNTWIGNLYVCPSKNMFNPITQMCGAAVPTRCQAPAAGN